MGIRKPAAGAAVFQAGILVTETEGASIPRSAMSSCALLALLSTVSHIKLCESLYSVFKCLSFEAVQKHKRKGWSPRWQGPDTKQS